jgi:hypothetical protein
LSSPGRPPSHPPIMLNVGYWCRRLRCFVKRKSSILTGSTSLCNSALRLGNSNKTSYLFLPLPLGEGRGEGCGLCPHWYANGNSISGTVGSALPYQTLTNTNSWRAPDNERGAPGKHTVFATDRFGSE